MEKNLLVENLLSVEEVAVKLGVKPSFFYSPRRRKGPHAVPVVRVGKYLKFDLTQVREWLLRQNQLGK